MLLFISNFYIISCSFLFVKNFFQLFLKSFCSFELPSSISAAAPCDVDYHITPSTECQHLFLKFFIFFKLFIQFKLHLHILRKQGLMRKKLCGTRTVFRHSFLHSFSSYIMMILGSKGHAFHACMKKHDFLTRKTPKSSHFS